MSGLPAPILKSPRIRSAVFGALLYIDNGESVDSAIDLMRESVQLSPSEAEQVRALVVMHVSLEGSDG